MQQSRKCRSEICYAQLVYSELLGGYVEVGKTDHIHNCGWRPKQFVTSEEFQNVMKDISDQINSEQKSIAHLQSSMRECILKLDSCLNRGIIT